MLGITKTGPVPLWLKCAYTLMVCIIIPIYWVQHGPSNFLWFSDIALLVMVPALWLDSRFLTSMMAVGVLPMEIAWLIDFVAGGFFGITGYMFGEGDLPFWLRALSGFHFFLPPVIILMLVRRGYDPRALWAQIGLMLVVMPFSYIYARYPGHNLNWALGPGMEQEVLPPLVYLGLWMATLPLIVYVPMHFLLRRMFKLPPGSKHRH